MLFGHLLTWIGLAKGGASIAGSVNGPRQRLVGVLLWFAISIAVQSFTKRFGDYSTLVGGGCLLLLMFIVTWRYDRNGLFDMLFGGLQLYFFLKALFAAFGLLGALQSSSLTNPVWPEFVRTASYVGALLLVNWRHVLDRVRMQGSPAEEPFSEVAHDHIAPDRAGPAQRTP